MTGTYTRQASSSSICPPPKRRLRRARHPAGAVRHSRPGDPDRGWHAHPPWHYIKRCALQSPHGRQVAVQPVLAAQLPGGGEVVYSLEGAQPRQLLRGQRRAPEEAPGAAAGALEARMPQHLHGRVHACTGPTGACWPVLQLFCHASVSRGTRGEGGGGARVREWAVAASTQRRQRCPSPC
jgi:hypothetical protein